ncbi:MAG TPA: DUF2577 family protein [Caproiciproducens sp.]|nr:DUF2577 family protein [Caproiciproducens sp.]
MKVNNPYNEMIAMMRRQGAKYNPPSIRFGKVIAPAPSLVISMGDLQIDKDNIIAFDGCQELVPGDMVMIMPSEDRQTYAVLCKAVNLSG